MDSKLGNVNKLWTGDHGMLQAESFLDWGLLHYSDTCPKSYDQIIGECANLEESARMEAYRPNEWRDPSKWTKGTRWRHVLAKVIRTCKGSIWSQKGSIQTRLDCVDPSMPRGDVIDNKRVSTWWLDFCADKLIVRQEEHV
jgi:hypothetical protein